MDDNQKLTACETCGKEVAKSANSCPHCGENLQRTTSKIIQIVGTVLSIILIGLGVLGLFLSCSDMIRRRSEKPKRVDSDTINTPQQIDDSPKFAVGESAELNDIIVTLKSVKESRGSIYNEPSEGKVLANCEFEIQNNSTEELSISSLLKFKLYCDDYKCEYSLIATGANVLEGKKTLDGSIAAGKKMLGIISYEIPKDWKELEIRFSPKVWGSKKFIFVATNPKHAKQQVED